MNKILTVALLISLVLNMLSFAITNSLRAGIWVIIILLTLQYYMEDS